VRLGNDYSLNDYPLNEFNEFRENSTLVWMRMIAGPDLIQKWLMVSIIELKENLALEVE